MSAPALTVPRPSPTVGIGPGSPVFAFDVGGTDIKSALFHADGSMLGLTRTRSPIDGVHTAEAVAVTIGELAVDLRERFPDVMPVAAGVLVPGIVDPVRGIGVFASNLHWVNAPIRALSERQLGLPVAFDHDVRGASWAEYELGGARDGGDVVLLVLGTGIAGALILGGRLHAAGGYAGEIGHAPVAEGPLCACGARGCLEAIASAGAITRRYAERSGIEVSGAREVIERADGGDRIAQVIWDDALDALAAVIAQLAAVIAPTTVVLGGGIAQAGDRLFIPLRMRLRARLSFHRVPDLVPARLGPEAGLMGAGLIARASMADASHLAVRGIPS